MKKSILFFVLVGGMMVSFQSVNANEPSIPWQCTSYTYTEASQEECIQKYSGEQGKKIAELERRVKHQEILISQLKQKADQQSRRQGPNFPQYQPPYYSPLQPILGGGPFGYGSLLGIGPGLLPFVAIVID